MTSLAGLAILGAGTVLAWGFDQLHRGLSPYDEGQHIDYLDQMLDLDMVRQGDLLGQDALQVWACRGAAGLIEPPCGTSPVDPGAYAWAGVNTAHVHPPTYYLFTSLPARLYLASGADLATAGRLVGGVWLGGGLLVLWGALGYLGVGALQRTIVVVLVGTTPAVLHANFTVNPDGSALLAGSLMMLAAAAWERRRIPTWGLAAAAAFAVALKLTNVLAVLASLVYLSVRAVLGRRRNEPAASPSRFRFGASALALGASLPAIAWLVIHRMLARVSTDPQEAFFHVDSLEVGTVLSQVWALVTPIDVQYMPPFLDSAMVRAAATLLELFLIAAVVVIAWRVRSLGRAAIMGMSGAAVMLTGGLILVIANYLLNSQIFVPIPARYGLSLMPFLGAALGGALRNSWLAIVGSALAIISIVVMGGGFMGGVLA